MPDQTPWWQPKSNQLLPARGWGIAALFISYFIWQQLVVLVFNVLLPINQILALVIGLALFALTFRFLKQYLTVTNSVKTAPIKIHGGIPTVLILTVVGTYALEMGWALFAKAVLHLQLLHQTSGNQSAIMTYFHHGFAPMIFMTLYAVVVAPAIEEFIFRAGLIQPDKTLPHQALRITLSILLFGFAHVVLQLGQLPLTTWCFYFGQYLVIGFSLTYLYVHYRNYRLNYLAHVTWNLLSLGVAMII